MSKVKNESVVRNHFATAVGAMCGSALLLGIAAHPVVAMSNYKWKYRPLIVCAANARDAEFIKQRSYINAAGAGMKSRDVVVILVAGNTVSTQFGPTSGMSASQLRSRCGAQRSEFRVVLIGKDGGTKRTSNSALSTSAIFNIIDAMPMRRDEMRRSR